MKKVWLLENQQARWFEFAEPRDMPNDVTVTMLAETEQPAQRTWVGLTDEEVEEIYMHERREDVVLLTQAKLKEKNNG